MDDDQRETLIWSLHAKRSVAKCVLRERADVAELRILQDDDLAICERFPDEDLARIRARALREGLVKRGWRDAS